MMLNNVFAFISEFRFYFPSLNRDRSKPLATAYDTTDKTKGTVSKNHLIISMRFSRLNPVCLCVCVCVCVCVCFYRLVKWTRQVKINILFS